MSRPKGSKNKATLAKELGMSLEEYNKLNSNTTDKNNTTKVTKGASEHPVITSSTKFLIPKKEEPNIETEEDELEVYNSEETEVYNSAENYKPGRNFVPDDIPLVPNLEEYSKRGFKEDKKKYKYHCEICGEGINQGSEYRLDLCHFLQLPEYWFTIENVKPILCRDCMIKIAKHLDLYFMSIGFKTKHDVKREDFTDLDLEDLDIER